MAAVALLDRHPLPAATVTPGSGVEASCACGCGQPLPQSRPATRKFYCNACRQRTYRKGLKQRAGAFSGPSPSSEPIRGYESKNYIKERYYPGPEKALPDDKDRRGKDNTGKDIPVSNDRVLQQSVTHRGGQPAAAGAVTPATTLRWGGQPALQPISQPAPLRASDRAVLKALPMLEARRNQDGGRGAWFCVSAQSVWEVLNGLGLSFALRTVARSLHHLAALGVIEYDPGLTFNDAAGMIRGAEVMPDRIILRSARLGPAREIPTGSLLGLDLLHARHDSALHRGAVLSLMRELRVPGRVRLRETYQEQPHAPRPSIEDRKKRAGVCHRRYVASHREERRIRDRERNVRRRAYFHTWKQAARSRILVHPSEPTELFMGEWLMYHSEAEIRRAWMLEASKHLDKGEELVWVRDGIRRVVRKEHWAGGKEATPKMLNTRKGIIARGEIFYRGSYAPGVPSDKVIYQKVWGT